MESLLGLSITLILLSTLSWIAFDIYRAKKSLDEERIRRKLIEYELQELKKRVDLGLEPIDSIIKRRNKGEKG